MDLPKPMGQGDSTSTKEKPGMAKAWWMASIRGRTCRTVQRATKLAPAAANRKGRLKGSSGLP